MKSCHQITDDETIYDVALVLMENGSSTPMGLRRTIDLLLDYGYKIWDLTSDELLLSHRYDGDLFTWLMFLSPDGRQIGVLQRGIGQSPRLQIWDAETAEVLRTA